MIGESKSGPRYAYLEGQLITLHHQRPEMGLADKASFPEDTPDVVEAREQELLELVRLANLAKPMMAALQLFVDLKPEGHDLLRRPASEQEMRDWAVAHVHAATVLAYAKADPEAISALGWPHPKGVDSSTGVPRNL